MLSKKCVDGALAHFLEASPCMTAGDGGGLDALTAAMRDLVTDASVLELISQLCVALARRELSGSLNVALHATDLLAKLVARSSADRVEDLLRQVEAVGRVLMYTAPHELAMANIFLRVLCIVKVEGGARVQDIRGPVLSEVDVILKDLQRVHTHIADQALEHIHAAEVVLTFGRSRTVAKFLEEAAKLRPFKVFVAESCPSYAGQDAALHLAKLGIDTTVVTDSAVFSIMSRVHKVIVGTHAVMHNGGLLAHSGAFNIAAAAKYHRVPFVVVSGLYKLSPRFAFCQSTVNDHGSPVEVIPFDKACRERLEVENPIFEYIPPEYVDLFVTDMGEYHPSYIYRLLAENYKPEDYSLFT